LELIHQVQRAALRIARVHKVAFHQRLTPSYRSSKLRHGRGPSSGHVAIMLTRFGEVCQFSQYEVFVAVTRHSSGSEERGSELSVHGSHRFCELRR
jgi:hypothetical protein